MGTRITKNERTIIIISRYYSYGEVISRNYIGKIFNVIINILKNNPNGKAEDINTNSSTSKWEKKDNKWYYYENGNMVTGLERVRRNMVLLK
ncbi:hypothetical protein ACSXED_16645 (plasmid) [Clostridium perfringens]|uniref:hypothetical protein n=1 Tax=Clostridium perfringens TaxID=1502 RepID=UPI003B02CFD3